LGSKREKKLSKGIGKKWGENKEAWGDRKRQRPARKVTSRVAVVGAEGNEQWHNARRQKVLPRKKKKKKRLKTTGRGEGISQTTKKYENSANAEARGKETKRTKNHNKKGNPSGQSCTQRGNAYQKPASLRKRGPAK